ncbi:hypothetical protein ACTWPB_12360 [Nocardia sp. IBHARD005]|uniref:hypothetical protein n=1 Tax=Nocardia sp. IBHARD005 TaxID=3457765 RepID=UPI004057EF0B
MTIEFDPGQAQISAFTQSARAGEFAFDEAAVMAAVSLYDTMIQDLMKVRVKTREAETVTGFGGFQSASDLQGGFSGKAAEGYKVIGQLIDAAMQMQEGLLCAANKVTEADALNQRRITLLEREIDGQR